MPEFSVSALAGAVKRTVEDAFGYVRVRGELGRVTLARSGHFYADLKDDKAVIASVMWKGSVQKLAFRPEEGLEVVCEGRLTTYAGRSQYQLIIERMEPAGVGALMALLEARKVQLAGEGLFAPERKVKLPFLPRVIGVVTSPTGAVIRDILHRVADRFPSHVLVWPVLVQGEKAAEQIARAIAGFNALERGGPVPRPDVLIVARGGGSIEDLWAFNEEIVVRAAAASQIPLISAVGHETDTTLIDFASDQRAPTPTGAAEIAVPVRVELKARCETLGGRLSTSLLRGLDQRGESLRAASRGLPRPTDLVEQRQQRLDAVSAALRAALLRASDQAAISLQRVAARLRPQALTRDVAERQTRVREQAGRAHLAWTRALQMRRERAEVLAGRLAARSPRARLGQAALELDRTAGRVGAAMARRLDLQARALDAAAARLESVNPKAVLARGYALVTDADGKVMRAAKDLKSGEVVGLEFADGQRRAVVDAAPSSGSGTGSGSGPSSGGGARATRKKRSDDDSQQGALL